jgi:hypothetical protein
MLNVWQSWMNAWRWRFKSSLPMKGECCTMRIVEVLISNGLLISVRFKIGRSTMFGVHNFPILHSSCGCSPIVAVEVDSAWRWWFLWRLWWSFGLHFWICKF